METTGSRIITTCAAFFVALPSAHADITHVETAPAPAAPAAEVGVAAGFAAAVTAAVGKEVSASKIVDGMPEALSAMVDQATLYMKHKRPTYIDAFKKALPAFDTAWAAYVERAKLVQAAVVKAEAATKDGKLADAQAALEAVITPVDITAEGLMRKVTDKGCIEPRDAEVVALQKLAELYLTQKDLRGAFQIPAARYDRRIVGAIDDERMLWLGCAAHDVLDELRSGQKAEVGTAIDKIFATIQQSQADRINLAWFFVTKLSVNPDMPAILPASATDVDKGQWVWFYVESPKPKGDTVLIADNVTINLAAAAPEWTRTEFQFYVAGKVKEKPRKGKGLVITDAFVPPIRLFNQMGYATMLTRSYYWLPVAALAEGMQNDAVKQMEAQERERMRKAAELLRALAQ